jgi:hypothetical protein
MKTIFLIFGLAFSLNLFADAGWVTAYKTRIFINTGERVIGWFEESAYFEIPEFQNNNGKDGAIYQMLKNQSKRFKKDSIIFYKKIQYPKYLTIDSEPKQLGAVDENDVFKIAFKDIKFTVFLKSEIAKRNWPLVDQLLITSKGMIDTLNTKWFTFVKIGVDLNGYLFYNYNAKINEAEIKRLFELKKNYFNKIERKKITKEQAKKEKSQGSYKFLFFKHENEIMSWFREKGIIMVYFHGTC